MKEHNKSKRIPFIKHIISVIVLLFVILLSQGSSVAKASTVNTGGQVRVTLDYLEEIAEVSAATGGSIRFYISTDKMKTWEIIERTGDKFLVDLSTLLTTKENIIYFKGDKETTPVEVKLQGEDKSLTVSYVVENGVGKIVYSNASLVEYRKGLNGAWKIASNNMPTAIYELKGASIYFRTPATKDKRVGKIVTVKISKRPSAPSVKLDGSKLLISGLKPEVTQYRVGSSTTWQTALKDQKTLLLHNLLEGKAYSNTPIPSGVVEFRTAGTGKILNSNVKVIEIPLQAIVPEYINLTGSSLTITDPNKKRYYEYTKVERGSALNILTAKWTSVTSTKSVIIPKVAVGDIILVRLKSTTDPTTKQIIPASTYKENEVKSITMK
jgi:hypothetical protein